MADKDPIQGPDVPEEYERYHASVDADYEGAALPRGVSAAHYIESLDGVGPDWDTGYLTKVQAHAARALSSGTEEVAEDAELPIDQQLARANAQAEELIQRLGGSAVRQAPAAREARGRKLGFLSGLGLVETERRARSRAKRIR